LRRLAKACGRLAVATALLLTAWSPALGHSGGAQAVPARQDALLYELPPAGSYELPAIQRVGEHRLLDPDGQRVPVLGLADGQCALVAFVYLHCADAFGCPLALASLQRTDRAVAERTDLRERVRLVTVSFDPERDTPAAMEALGRSLSPRSDWRFLTAGSRGELEPVLRDFGQDAVPLLTSDGEDTGLLQHVLKVFLVDDRGDVRNVYSTGFLDYRILLRDLETLLLAP
jgi:cytochrome oxidase Cu insertion factor (SCO1/SenC/PrrC family)